MTLPGDALLTCAEMAACDRLTIAAGTSGFTLMQRAGTGAAAALRRRIPPGRVLVACGPGNNGGDGYIIADDLGRHGWNVTVASLVPIDQLKGDAAGAAALWDGPVQSLDTVRPVDFDVLVDAVFGAGLTRAIDGEAAALLSAAGQAVAAGVLRVVAIDVPSGLHGDTGQALGPVCPAELTVTFHRRKPGHLLYPGRGLCGAVRVIDIGIDQRACAEVKASARINTPALWGLARPQAGPGDHKYSRGHVIVVAGAMSGAARLATAVLKFGVPAVLDADLFTLFAGRALPTTGPAVLTPHTGEFRRFRPGIDPDTVGRLDAVTRMARETGHVVLLKGPDTTIADPDGRCAIQENAPFSLATGGSGDVLSGAIAGLIGQGMASYEATAAGSWLHAEAAQALGDRPVLAEELADALVDGDRDI